MSEEEIIDRVMMIDQWKVSGDIYTQNELNAIGELLDLYNKEKEKNKELEEKQLKKSGIYEIGIDLDDDYIPKSKVRELQNKYKNKIEKLESKKIWNEPVDTINKNRYTNYYNAYEEILQEGDK